MQAVTVESSCLGALEEIAGWLISSDPVALSGLAAVSVN